MRRITRSRAANRKFAESLRRKPIQMGEVGSRTNRWRKLLIRKGFVVAESGAFDAKLLNATKVAQNWARVDVDGLVGPITWRAVSKKKRTRRPLTTIRHLLPMGIVKPKVIDCRDGKSGFPQHRTRRWQKRSRREIRVKLGHYTGGPASFLADARFHVNSDYLTKGGAPALAYWAGVDKDGTIFLFNDWDDVTWHCDGGKNTVALGYVFRGGSEGPNWVQKRSLEWLHTALERGYFGFGTPTMPTASTTHRHVTATSCPGQKGEAFYREIAGDRFRTTL